MKTEKATNRWIDRTNIGYEISFNRYFYKPQPTRNLEGIRTDILALEEKAEELLGEIIGSTEASR